MAKVGQEFVGLYNVTEITQLRPVAQGLMDFTAL